MKSYTTLRNLWGSLSQNNSNENLSLGDQLNNDSQKYLIQKYFNNEGSYTTPTIANQQAYLLPFNYSKIKDITVTVGSIRYVATEVLTRADWDRMNFIQYTSDIPAYYFIYGNYINIFPVPSSNGNTITINYKYRAIDLNLADYTTGTVTATNNSTTVTGSGTSWLTPFVPSASSVINLNLWIQIASPKGDNNWYQIASIDSATQITLVQPYQGTTTTGANFTIGQMPILLEDFHDLIVYRSLHRYFSSINRDPQKALEFKQMYDDGAELLSAYSGDKSSDVALDTEPPLINPNLFLWKP